MSTIKADALGAATGVNTDLELSGKGTGGIVLVTSSSQTPANNGDLVIEATSNTLLTFRLKGSDGTVRTGTLALS